MSRKQAGVLRSASGSEMPALLLHICCGPCSIMPVSLLREAGYEPVCWFMNPNIQPLAEYLRRREAAGQCAEKLDIEIQYEDNWDIQDWLEKQLPFANSQQRCERCVAWRLEAAARKALELGLPCFSSSLLYSRYQPHDYIRQRGTELANELGLEFVYQDFRTDWQAGIDISRQWGVYRQPYCGCVFSEAERYAKKIKALQKK